MAKKRGMDIGIKLNPFERKIYCKYNIHLDPSIIDVYRKFNGNYDRKKK